MSNELMTVQTMSSHEIAELMEKRHDNVLRDIRVMLIELHGEGGVLRFKDTLRNEQNGQLYPVYNLPKRETLILTSGYSVELRAKIIDRWAELEAQALQLNLNDPDQLLHLLISQVQQRKELAARQQALLEDNRKLTTTVTKQAPKVQVYDRIVESNGGMVINDAAKALQVKPGALRYHLIRQRWIWRSSHSQSYVPYQARIDSGLMEVKTRPTHNGIAKVVRITARGMALLAKEFNDGHP